SSRRRHTRSKRDWSSDVCSSDLHFEQVRNIPVKVFHLDDLIQCLVDDIDGAMPRTPPISLHGIHAVLSPDKVDTEVATSIVFAQIGRASCRERVKSSARARRLKS